MYQVCIYFWFLLFLAKIFFFLNILNINVYSSEMVSRKNCGDVSNFSALSYFVHNSDP